jgi:hypothetical protein
LKNFIRGLFVSAFLITPSLAHQSDGGQKYDAWCCNPVTKGAHMISGDCAPIKSHSVKPVKGGYQVTLDVGDHPLSKTKQVHFITYGSVKESTDGEYHACLYPDETVLRCFYAPPMSY